MAYDAQASAVEVATSDFGTVIAVDTTQAEGRAVMRDAMARLSAPSSRPEAFCRALSIVRSKALLALLDDTTAWVALKRQHAVEDCAFAQNAPDRSAAIALAELTWPHLYAPRPEPNGHVHSTFQGVLNAALWNQGLSADPTRGTRQVGENNMNLEGR